MMFPRGKVGSKRGHPSIEPHGGVLTRVVCSTLPSRGRSLTPVSRIEMLEDSRAFVERNDDTHKASGFAIAKSLIS